VALQVVLATAHGGSWVEPLIKPGSTLSLGQHVQLGGQRHQLRTEDAVADAALQVGERGT
jgi:hypothetical protein